MLFLDNSELNSRFFYYSNSNTISYLFGSLNNFYEIIINITYNNFYLNYYLIILIIILIVRLNTYY